MDEYAEAAERAMDPPWDEVTEARVLARLHGGLPEARSTRGPSVLRRALVGSIAAASLAAAAVAFLVLTPSGPDHRNVASIGPKQPSKPAPAEVEPDRDSASVLRLADGSTAHLDRDAAVAVALQDASRVLVQQDAGRVRYVVVPDADRAFEVESGPVTVRVVGTVFTVNVLAGTLEVAVERGRVEVTSEHTQAVLGAGDTVTMSTRLGPTTSEEPPRSGRPAAGEPSASPSDEPAPEPTIDELFDRVDSARAAGDLDLAAATLRELLARRPDNQTAWFVLGRVEEGRGDHAAAATAFASSHRANRDGPVAEDALAQQAVSWMRAGDADAARRAARSYLQEYSGGTHARQMRLLAR